MKLLIQLKFQNKKEMKIKVNLAIPQGVGGDSSDVKVSLQQKKCIIRIIETKKQSK